MLLCAKARFLTSSQMAGLCRSELALMGSRFHIKLPGRPKLTWPFTYVENPGACSAREAFSLLRSLPRK